MQYVLTVGAAESTAYRTDGGSNGYITVMTKTGKSQTQMTPGVYSYVFSAKTQFVSNYAPYVAVTGITAKMSMEETFSGTNNSSAASYNADFSKSVNCAEISKSSYSSNGYNHVNTKTTVSDPAFGYCKYEFNISI